MWASETPSHRTSCEVAVVANVSLHGFLLAGAWFAEFLRFLEQRGAMERVETVPCDGVEPVRTHGTARGSEDVGYDKELSQNKLDDFLLTRSCKYCLLYE